MTFTRAEMLAPSLKLKGTRSWRQFAVALEPDGPRVTACPLLTGAGMPLDAVMRRAGVLPDHGEVLPEARDWSARLMLLNPEQREAVVQAMDNVLRIAEGLHYRPPRSR